MRVRERAWRKIMSFFGSLFGGQNSTLDSLIPTFGQVGGNQVGQGQKNQSTASDFWNSIVGGDATKTMQALSPEVSAEKKSSQLDTKTATEMGNRSGGTNASNAASKDKIHSDVTNLIGNLTNSSASNLASLGTSQVSTGLSAYGMQEQASQEQLSNWRDSILGKGITSAAAFAESYGLNKIPGAKNSQNNNPGEFFNSTTSGYQPVYDDDGNQIA
jgi:hypothetical protein